ncbi:hypothetical protein [Henriciella marina]|uniref:hypothetical protein n=1 Tax=Henriciella marina TaxID=453851 RepID=UPI00037B1F12|nr:hypothetical protein [Henriciella marina]
MRSRSIGLLLGATVLASCGRPYGLEEAIETYEQHAPSLAEVAFQRVDAEDIDGLSFEYVDIYKGGDGGADRIVFTLKTYGLSIGGRTVGLVYARSIDPADYQAPGNQLFRECDAAAIAAADALSNGAISCRLDESWLAFQISD